MKAKRWRATLQLFSATFVIENRSAANSYHLRIYDNDSLLACQNMLKKGMGSINCSEDILLKKTKNWVNIWPLRKTFNEKI